MLKELNLRYDPDRSRMTLIIDAEADTSEMVVDLTWQMDDLKVPVLFKQVLLAALEYVELNDFR